MIKSGFFLFFIFLFSLPPKPKCGFLPFSRFISHVNAVKRCMTRFRMHQALKLHQEEVIFLLICLFDGVMYNLLLRGGGIHIANSFISTPSP